MIGLMLNSNWKDFDFFFVDSVKNVVYLLVQQSISRQ